MFKFDAKMTKWIKGVAIMIMVAHHLFTSVYTDSRFLIILGHACKICVGIYAFLSGFGYFYMKNKGYGNSFKRIRGLLERYWLQLFLIFIPLAVAGGYVVTAENFFINLFSLRPSINWFSWYVYFYIFLMLVIPLYAKLCCKNFFINVGATIVVTCLVALGVHELPWYPSNVFINALYDCLLYFPVAALGYLFARHDVFTYIQSKILKIQKSFFLPVIGIIMCAIAMVGKFFLSMVYCFNMDVIYVPIFIFGIFQVFGYIRARISDKWFIVLSILGMYSTEIWFLHSIFFSAETNVVVNFSNILWMVGNPILAFLWCFVLCLPVAFILHFIVDKFDYLIDKKIFVKRSKKPKDNNEENVNQIQMEDDK